MARFDPDDDFIGVTGEDRSNGKALYDPDVLVLGSLMVYPESQTVLEEEMERAELMGYDLDNQEIMSGWLKKMAKRIVKRVKTRIRARRKKGGRSPVTVSTPRGQVTIGPGGVQYTTAPRDSALVPTRTTQASAFPGGGIVEMVKSNPLLLAIPASLLVFFLLRKRR